MSREIGVALEKRLPTLAIGLVTVFLGARFFIFIYKYSVNLFFWDQWDYLTPFFRGNPRVFELFFWQHGPHREGVGLIADKFLYPLTCWNSRTDSFVIGACIFIATLLAIALKRRILGPITLSDVALPTIFLTLAQYDGLTGTPNPSYAAFPLLMIMLYCLSLLLANAWIRFTVVLPLNFLLIYTGFGFFIGPVTLAVFALECYWSFRRQTHLHPAAAFAGLLIAAGSSASFFIHYTWTPAVGCYRPPHLSWDYPWFVAVLWSRLLVRGGSLLFITVLGAILVISAMVIGIRSVFRLFRRGPDLTSLVTFVLITFSLLFSINAAVGRVCLGLPEAAQASRYVTLMIPGFFGIYLFMRANARPPKERIQEKHTVIAHSNIRQLVLSLFVIAVLVGAGTKRISNLHLSDTDGKRAWAECYRRTGDIQGCEASTHFKIHPNPEGTGLPLKLAFLQEKHLNLFSDQSR